MTPRVGVRILLVAALAFSALLPVYPTGTVDFEGWFGPPGRNFRYDNGTSFHSLIEVGTGAFDWNLTRGQCVSDAGGWTRYQAHPAFVLAYPPGIAGLWLGLRFVVSRAATPRGRSLKIAAIGSGLVAPSVPWLVWNGVIAAYCPTSVAASTIIAAVLIVPCLGFGVALIVARRRLAEMEWP